MRAPDPLDRLAHDVQFTSHMRQSKKKDTKRLKLSRSTLTNITLAAVVGGEFGAQSHWITCSNHAWTCGCT
jgi:hypothetical protein